MYGRKVREEMGIEFRDGQRVRDKKDKIAVSSGGIQEQVQETENKTGQNRCKRKQEKKQDGRGA